VTTGGCRSRPRVPPPACLRLLRSPRRFTSRRDCRAPAEAFLDGQLKMERICSAKSLDLHDRYCGANSAEASSADTVLAVKTKPAASARGFCIGNDAVVGWNPVCTARKTGKMLNLRAGLPNRINLNRQKQPVADCVFCLPPIRSLARSINPRAIHLRHRDGGLTFACLFESMLQKRLYAAHCQTPEPCLYQ
jgi:hypothetical protein